MKDMQLFAVIICFNKSNRKILAVNNFLYNAVTANITEQKIESRATFAEVPLTSNSRSTFHNSNRFAYQATDF